MRPALPLIGLPKLRKDEPAREMPIPSRDRESGLAPSLERSSYASRETQLQQAFGKHVRELRLARGLTQHALAERSDLSVDGVRRIERGAFSPSLSTVAHLCDGLEVSLSSIFGSIDGTPRQDLNELSDYLARRSPAEQRLALRVLRALFEGEMKR